MVKWKSHLGKKNLPISLEWKDAHISNVQPKRTLIHMRGAKITALGSCVHKLFMVFQVYTCLKCTPSTLPENSYFYVFFSRRRIVIASGYSCPSIMKICIQPPTWDASGRTRGYGLARHVRSSLNAFFIIIYICSCLYFYVCICRPIC